MALCGLTMATVLLGFVAPCLPRVIGAASHTLSGPPDVLRAPKSFLDTTLSVIVESFSK